jgi:hypothetical protein
LRESDANFRVYNDARGGDGASDLRARGAWCPGDDGRATESELTEWTEPRSDAADALDAVDDADAERWTRLEYGVPCGSGVDAPAGNASGVDVPGVEADEDRRLRGHGSGADGRSSASQRPATGPAGFRFPNHPIDTSGSKLFVSSPWSWLVCEVPAISAERRYEICMKVEILNWINIQSVCKVNFT